MVRIRAITPADNEALQDIERVACERFRDVGLDSVADDEPFPIDVLTAYASAGRGWLAVDPEDLEGAPNGYVVVELVDGFAHVEQVSVRPDHQGMGVGRALVDRVAQWAAAAGCAGVTLTTYADVPWNRPLFEHLGFRVLADNEIGPGLRAVRVREALDGLDPARRVCMRLDLDARPPDPARFRA